jgi:protein kinase-like protein
LGTPAYLSPEQILGEPQNTRSDLFSLGIVLYQMVTNAAPFDGSSVSAVCAQILQAEPVPPSQRNPLVPAELDRIILRCLAKSSADRYPSADAFATSLDAAVRQGNSGGNVAATAGAATASAGIGADGLPWATASVDPAGAEASANVSANRKRKSGWFARPLQASDAWFAAAAAVILLCSMPLARAMRAKFHVPPAPVAGAAPHAPHDLTGETQYTEVAVDEEADVAPETIKLAQQRAKAIAKIGTTHAVQPAAKNVSTMTAVSAPVMPLPVVAMPIARPVEKAALKIEIDSSVGEGALAVFADQTLLYTMDLKANEPGAPVKLEQTLPPGPHQLRVVLYRADKSLQVAKEGLGEMRTDSTNMLRIHVSKKAKMLVKHENALDVAWPSAMGPAPISAANYAGTRK